MSQFCTNEETTLNYNQTGIIDETNSYMQKTQKFTTQDIASAWFLDRHQLRFENDSNSRWQFHSAYLYSKRL